MLFTKKVPPGGYAIEKEGNLDVMRINYEGNVKVPSIENDPNCMAFTIDKLLEVPSTSKIIFHQRRNYTYDYAQTQMLVEVTNLYNYLVKQKRIIFSGREEAFFSNIRYLVLNLLKSDPLGAFVELKRLLREEKIKLGGERKAVIKQEIEAKIDFLQRFYNYLEKLTLVKLAKPYLDGYVIGDRTLYQRFFRPIISPDFMFTKLMSKIPMHADEVDYYKLDRNTEVTIFKIPGKLKYLYHILPPEFKLSEDKYELLDLAKNVLAEHKPKEEEFIDPDRMRQTFYNIGADLIQELSEHKNLDISLREIKELANILVRYTVGFGLIETLLKDKKIQDITINGPIGQTPIFIVHQDYDDCLTNLYPAREDGDGWATKFRLLSGRPLDEANPVLDTELIIPHAKARVAIIGNPLNPWGLGYAFRRHRDKPWTLPLFVHNNMISPLGAGLISFLVDGARTMLIAGTRSSGKTSLLGSTLVEIMRKYRIISVEDSVTGDSEILTKINGQWQRTTIGKLVDDSINKYNALISITGHEVAPNPENIEIFAMDKKGKIRVTKPSCFIRHKISKPIYEIKTRTGRKIKVTGDHSLFNLGTEADIKEVKANNLKIGDRIFVPKCLPLINQFKEFIDIFDKVADLEEVFVTGEETNSVLKKYFKEITSFGLARGYSIHTIKAWKTRKLLPSKIIKDLVLLYPSLDFSKDIFKIGENSIKKLPLRLSLDNDFLTFLGLWIADGCYDKTSVIISCNDIEDREIFSRVAEKFGLEVKFHSDKISYMLNSKTLKIVMRDILGFTGNAYTKRIPSWVFNLAPIQIASFLKGIFSGDGCATDKEVAIGLSSEELLKDLRTLLLLFGITLRVGKRRERDLNIHANISKLESLNNFSKYIGFLQHYKTKRLNILCKKNSTHDTTDNFNFDLRVKQELAAIFKRKFNKNDYIVRENAVGRKKLAALLQFQNNENILLEKLATLVDSDVLLEEIKEINIIDDFSGYVYDLSVPECESFICENIVAHNTLELPTEALRKLGYNIQPMRVRAALSIAGRGGTGADEGIRTSLRMGDSSLIVGEVRSSIRGNEEVIIIENGDTKRLQIKDLEGKDIKNIYIPSMDADLKVRLKKLLAFVKHPKRDKLLRVKTRTGREITVTPDHSLFTSHNFSIYPIECKDLKIGGKLVLPSRLPCGYNDINSINLLDQLSELRVVNFEEPVREAIVKLGWKKATEIYNIKSGDIYNYYRTNQKTNIPINSFINLMQESNTSFNSEQLLVKTGTSTTIPVTLPVNEDFCHWLGYYISEGYYSDKEGGRIVITNSDERVLNHISCLSKNLFNITPDRRDVYGAGHSIQLGISCKPLTNLISKLGCGSICTEKRIPSFIYGLSKKKIAAFLRALYEGDGSITVSKSSGNAIRYHTTSKKLAEDVAYLLLVFGIVAKIYFRNVSKGDRLWTVGFKDREMVENFMKEVGFVFKGKEILIRSWPHTKANSVCFDKEVLEENLINYPRKYRHLFRFLKCSKNYLRKVINDQECEVSNKLRVYAEGDFYIDEVKEIEEVCLKEDEYVYDLSVEPGQNFVGGFGGILLHNTEAKALYEAMRVGALANVVAGTIHGDSPYGVFDRVVNDLGVPRTSFKATDMVIIANPIKSSDGLHRWRRVTQITEVRKHWEEDPLREKGFVDLMKYDSKQDFLVPTEDLLNGDSDTLKAVAENVKEWVGDWDAVWDNILLRAKIKEATVDYANKSKDLDLLEAESVIASNDMFHIISASVREEAGSLDSERIYKEWEDWFKKYVREKKGA